MIVICLILAIIIGVGTIHVAEHSTADDIRTWTGCLLLFVLLLCIILASAPKTVQAASFITMFLSMAGTAVLTYRRDYGHQSD